MLPGFRKSHLNANLKECFGRTCMIVQYKPFLSIYFTLSERYRSPHSNVRKFHLSNSTILSCPSNVSTMEYIFQCLEGLHICHLDYHSSVTTYYLTSYNCVHIYNIFRNFAALNTENIDYSTSCGSCTNFEQSQRRFRAMNQILTELLSYILLLSQS